MFQRGGPDEGFEEDEEVVRDAEASLAALRTEVQRREVEALLSGEADANDIS